MLAALELVRTAISEATEDASQLTLVKPPGLPLIRGDRQAIDDELQRIRPLLDRGGYVPHVDHAVPADVAWGSFCYYREQLNQIVDARAHAPASQRRRRR